MTKITLLFLAKMLKKRFAILIFAGITTVFVIAGCGGSSGGGGSSSGGDLAGFASPGSLVFVEGDLNPSKSMKANIDAMAKKVAGIEDLGSYVISKLESSAKQNGESVDFASEVEPWLGERASVAFEHLEDGELSEPLIAIETTRASETEAFVDKRAQGSAEPAKSASYKGVDFKIGGPENDAVGVVDNALVIANGEREFKAAVDSAEGESLGDEARFQDAISAAAETSFADVYVDVGGIIDQSKGQVDPQAQEIFKSAGIDPSEATAVASIIPQSDHLEIDLSSDIGEATEPSEDVAKMLGSLPDQSLAAVAFSGFGEKLEEAIDSIDESGVPPDLKPNQLKSTLSQAGIDLDQIAGSFKDGAIFLEGGRPRQLGGALVLTTEGSTEAADAIANLGTLLRGARVPGVTVISGNGSGFSIKSPELGAKPAVVLAKGDRLAIGYGLEATYAGLDPEAGGGETLADNPGYQAAISLLGETTPTGYANGPEAVHLAELLVPRSSTDFWEIVPYLKVSYIAFGPGEDTDRATTKVIVGLGS